MTTYLDVPFDSAKSLLQTEINSSIPILERQQDYSVSVVKTQIPLHGMPVFIPELELKAPTAPAPWINTVYKSKVVYAPPPFPGPPPQVFDNIVTFSPETSDPQPTDDYTQQPKNRYAWMYSFNSVAQMVNGAFQTMIASIPDAPNRPIISAYFDDTKQRFCIGITPYNYAAATFYFSNNMRFIFQGFQLKENSAYPGYFSIVFTPKYSNIICPTPSGTNFYWSNAPVTSVESNPWGSDLVANSSILLESNWTNLSFSPIKSIIIVTNMEIASEATISFNNIPAFTKTQIVFYDYVDGKYVANNVESYKQTASSFTLNVIADFTVDILNLSDTQGYLTYNASVIKDSRLVKMYGQGILQSMSFSIEWVDVWGYIRTVETQSRQENAVLKLAFIKV
jgi:hypothetical protein